MGPGTAVSTLGKGIAAAAGVIAVVTVLSRLAGFVRTLVFADSVRAAGVGEIYNAVNAVPNVLYEVAAGGALAAVAVPLIAGHLGAGRIAEAGQVGSALLTWAVTILIPLGVAVAALAGPIATWLVGDQVSGGAASGAVMLRIFAIQIPLYGVGVVLAGILQAHQRFLAAAVAPLLSSLVVIGTYVAYGAIADGRTMGVGSGAVSLLAWGTTAGVILLSLPLLIPALRTGWRWRPTWRFPAGEAVRARRLAGAGVLALAGQQVATVVIIWLASHRGGGQGTLSVYNWIQAVYLLPYAVLAVPLATATFPSLAAGDAGGAVDAADGTRVVGTLATSLRAVVLLTGLGGCLLVVGAPFIGRFFALLDARRGAGQVSGEAVTGLTAGLQAFAPGLIGFAASAVLIRALYVRGRPLVGALVVAGGWLIAALGPAVVLAPGTSARDLLVGLGIWSSIGMSATAVVLAVLVSRAWGGPLPGVRAAAVAAVVAFVVASLLGLNIVRFGVPAGLVETVLFGIGSALLATLLYLGCIWVGDRDSLTLLDPRRPRRTAT